MRCLVTFDVVESLVAQKRSVDQSAGKLKLRSKSLNISGEVLLDQLWLPHHSNHGKRPDHRLVVGGAAPASVGRVEALEAFT